MSKNWIRISIRRELIGEFDGFPGLFIHCNYTTDDVILCFSFSLLYNIPFISSHFLPFWPAFPYSTPDRIHRFGRILTTWQSAVEHSQTHALCCVCHDGCMRQEERRGCSASHANQLLLFQTDKIEISIAGPRAFTILPFQFPHTAIKMYTLLCIDRKREPVNVLTGLKAT